MTRIGTVLSLAGATIAELAAAPLDVIWIDLEHGALDVRDVQTAAIAAQSTGSAVSVRVPSVCSDRLPAILDAGIDGIVAPRIETAADAAELVGRLHYPPEGSRGYGPRRSGWYGRLRDVPAAVECTVQIETPPGVERADRIAAVPGVDAIVVGCSDLALALGVPGDLRSSLLRDAVDRVAAAAAAGGVGFGLAGGGDIEELVALAAGRADVIVYSVDVRLFSGAVDAVVRTFATALGEAHVGA